MVKARVAYVKSATFRYHIVPPRLTHARWLRFLRQHSRVVWYYLTRARVSRARNLLLLCNNVPGNYVINCPISLMMRAIESYTWLTHCHSAAVYLLAIFRSHLSPMQTLDLWFTRYTTRVLCMPLSFKVKRFFPNLWFSVYRFASVQY